MTQSRINKIISRQKLILPVFMGISVFMFFLIKYSFHLHYEEQLQMFLFSKDYFCELCSVPGGFADYLGTFFTQFYYYSLSGALIIALLLVGLQQIIHKVASTPDYDKFVYLLSFIPSILFLAILCDENYTLSGLISFVIATLMVLLYKLITHSTLRMVLLVVFSPVVYWACGGGYVLFTLSALLLDYLFFKEKNKSMWVLRICIVLIYTGILPLIAKQLIQFPLDRLYFGMCYNRFPVISVVPFIPVVSIILLLPLLYRIRITIKNKSLYLTTYLLLLSVLISGSVIYIKSMADYKKEEIMAYDYYARTGQWDKITQMANRHDPDSPLSVCCLNLALSKTGKLNDCMFRYYQNGPEGLLPSFKRDFTLPFVAGEAYYHLGLINTSMRYSFEAMEAIPDNKKSVRAIQRIAEINMLNGYYAVAEKYYSILRQTLFYRSWATNALKYNNSSNIDKNPEYSHLHKIRVEKDFLFSEMEKDQVLGLLYTHNMNNREALEYLISYSLLTKDLDHFVQYFSIGKKMYGKNIPAHIQEALVYTWYSKTRSLTNIPWPINDAVKLNFEHYMQSGSSAYASESAIRNDYGQTYWYYLQFRK